MKYKTLIISFALATTCLFVDRSLSARQRDDERSPEDAASSSSPSGYLRLTRDSTGAPSSLETSITRFRSEDGKFLVDLIGVVHLGERDYYRKLNHQFTQYDALLYELVAPPERRIPDRETASGNDHPIRWLQGSMQRMLGLESQLKHIDYQRPNFVHADLSPGEMKRKMADRGDNAWTVGLKAVLEILQQQQARQPAHGATPGGELPDLDQLLDMLSDPTQLKTLIAEQFVAGGLEMGLGSTLNQLLITDRNEAAMRVLNQQIEKGQTRLAIFYGAAHMPDFEKRLINQLGMRKTKRAWVEAWNLKPQASGSRSDPASILTDLFRQLMEDQNR